MSEISRKKPPARAASRARVFYDAVAVATTRRAVVAKPPPVEYPRVAPAVFELPDEDASIHVPRP